MILRIRHDPEDLLRTMLDGRHANRWMVNTISPDVGEWYVRDPNSADRRG